MKNLITKARDALSPMRLASRFAERLCLQETVLQGPFSGIRLAVESSFVSSIRTLLLGTYEMDLWPYIQQGIRVGDGAIIVGAAEGYYAIGLAQLLGGKKVIAFELEPKGRRLLQENAQKNSVEDRLEILGECDADGFCTVAKRFSHPFVVVDVEGAEAKILCETDSFAFDEVTFLVEIHDFVDRSLGDSIRTRFQKTHSIIEIWQQPRCAKDLPSSLPLRRTLWRWYQTLISEGRPERMRWFFLTPKTALAAQKDNGVSV